MNRLTRFFLLFLFLSTAQLFAQTNFKDLENRDGKWFLKGSAKPFTGQFVEYNNDGNIIGKGKFLDGLLEGQRMAFSDSGDTLFLRTYHKGSGFGPAKEFYPGGKVKQEGELKRNKENGVWKFFREDGSLESEITYANGVQEGECHEYSASGKLIKKYYIKGGNVEYGHTVKKLMDEGLQKYREGNYQEAVEAFTKAIAENVTIAEAYFDRAACEGLLLNYKQAINDYDTAIVLNPTYKEAYLNRGCAKINIALKNGSKSQDLKIKSAACEDLHKATELGLDNEEIRQMIQFHCESSKLQ